MAEPIFRKARRCDANTCVEVAAAADKVMVRDSKLGDQSPVISFGAPHWRAFLTAVKHGNLRP